MTITITPSARPPLDIDYGGTVYRLPGRIPASILEAENAVPRIPRNSPDQLRRDREMEVGRILIAAFIVDVIPEDFRRVLDLADIEQVFEAWSEHVDLGKSSGSSNSGTSTPKRSRTNSAKSGSVSALSA